MPFDSAQGCGYGSPMEKVGRISRVDSRFRMDSRFRGNDKDEAWILNQKGKSVAGGWIPAFATDDVSWIP